MGYKRSKEDKRRLKKLHFETKNRYAAGVWYDDRKQRYIKYSRSDFPGAGFFHKLSNKKVRRDGNVVSGGSYKKVFDYKYHIL